MKIYDPITLVKELLSRESVTPNDGGCMEYLDPILRDMGFEITYFNFGDTKNMYARHGTNMPNFCFLGHTDVVPAGRLSLWESEPFKPTEKDGYLVARGAADMKGAIAAYIAAVSQFLLEPLENASLSILLTSDEEGVAVNGTQRAIKELKGRSEYISACLVGEPTNPTQLGQMYKIGRRGSLNATLTIGGKMGHVAYPQMALNPIYPLTDFLNKVATTPLDEGCDSFEPSRLEVTSIDTENPIRNVIPGVAKVRFNVRFNPLHTGETLKIYLKNYIKEIEEKYPLYGFSLDLDVSGEAFMCKDLTLRRMLEESVNEVCEIVPQASTSGGTSDARFLYTLCPVIEFGLLSNEAHKANEKVAIDDLFKLTEIYRRVLDKYFPRSLTGDFEFNFLDR